MCSVGRACHRVYLVWRYGLRAMVGSIGIVCPLAFEADGWISLDQMQHANKPAPITEGVQLSFPVAQLERVLADLRAVAARSEGHWLVRVPLPNADVWIISFSGTSSHPHTVENVQNGAAEAPKWQVPRHADADTPFSADNPKMIAPAVEAALEAYHNPDALAVNALTHILNLNPFQNARDNPSNANGLALRRAIDAAMRAIERMPMKRTSRLAHYFRMRYVEGVTQLEAASSFDRTERTANRTKHKLIEHLSHELLRLCKPQH